MTDHRSGFRLARLELYNWGTFDQRVWILVTDVRNWFLFSASERFREDCRI